MKQVVVTGGSGFLGSHTADELTDRGYFVTIFDSVESPWIRDSQRMVVGDILDRSALLTAFDGASIVYHFAGVTDLDEASKRPLDTIRMNVLGTSNVIDVVQELGIQSFIYASTMYVYSPYGSFYRASKQAAETLIEAYHEKYGFDYTFLRYGSLYGPRAQDWNGLRRYVQQIVRDGKLTYDGTGKERREYIHVKDAARLSVDVLDEQHKNKAVTVTGSQVLTSQELIELIFEIAGIKAQIEYVPQVKEGYHYINTPYRYTPKQAKKLVPREFVDLGQGVLEIVEEMHHQIESGGSTSAP